MRRVVAVAVALALGIATPAAAQSAYAVWSHEAAPPAQAPPTPASPPAASAASAVAFAFAQVGKEYRWGAAGPDSYDCSGLVQAAWRAGGVALPRTSQAQYRFTRHVSRSMLRPGDVVYFFHASHVAFYIGGGRAITASHSGTRVRIVRIDTMPIYGYGRPAPGGETSV